MTFRFGRFELDEAARLLRLDGAEIPLQPRVFDLLVYLVRNGERVVTKDELLDVLWPGVTVTEASLQRAVSLARAALRKGGMEEALRSFARVGYRFCVDDGCGEAGPGSATEPPDASAQALRAADEAMAGQRWEEAVSRYRQADAAGTLEGAELDRWALAWECLGKPSEAIPLLTRAVAAHALAGRAAASARSAIVLSKIHLERGETAVSKGWIARAERLLGAEAAPHERGLLLWMQARIASTDGEPRRALELADRAYHLGRATEDAEVEALGLMYRGFYRLCLDQTREGLEDQDHAAALALSSDLDPVTGNTIYCNILWACRTFGDWARANQWTLGYQQWCSAKRMGYSGACQLHRAEVLGVRGTFQEALAHVETAIASLPADAPWALGDAYRVLGDIHAAIGDDEAAMTAYEKAYALGWDAEPGHAMLLLERGEGEAAFASLERSLIGNGWWTLQRQGILMAHLAVVAAATDRRERATDLVGTLTGQAERWPMPSIRALTAEATAVLAMRRDDPRDALRHLHLARQLWTSIESRFHAARLRLGIAELLLALGERSGAATELRAACMAAEALGSKKLAARCAALQAS